MAYGPNYNGPIWIDPRWYEQYRVGAWRTGTSDRTEVYPDPMRPIPGGHTPVDEERIRELVREEMADLVNPDVPDAPPEDWNG